MAKGNKIPRHAVNVQPKKTPKWVPPNIGGSYPLAWRFSGCDSAGPFAWTTPIPANYTEILERLHEFEKMQWKDIVSSGSHTIPVAQLEKNARDRLTQIERDDIDELMSFRISGAGRLWCVKGEHIMHILWWDPNHQVYVVPVDRTDRDKRNRRRNS